MPSVVHVNGPQESYSDGVGAQQRDGHAILFGRSTEVVNAADEVVTVRRFRSTALTGDVTRTVCPSRYVIK